MYKIEAETRRSMAQAWGMATIAFIAPAVVAFRLSKVAAVEAIVLMPLLVALFPLVGQFARDRRARYAGARERWRQEYRASPDSRLIRLNDSH